MYNVNQSRHLLTQKSKQSAMTVYTKLGIETAQ